MKDTEFASEVKNASALMTSLWDRLNVHEVDAQELSSVVPGHCFRGTPKGTKIIKGKCAYGNRFIACHVKTGVWADGDAFGDVAACLLVLYQNPTEIGKCWFALGAPRMPFDGMALSREDVERTINLLEGKLVERTAWGDTFYVVLA